MDDDNGVACFLCLIVQTCLWKVCKLQCQDLVEGRGTLRMHNLTAFVKEIHQIHNCWFRTQFYCLRKEDMFCTGPQVSPKSDDMIQRTCIHDFKPNSLVFLVQNLKIVNSRNTIKVAITIWI